MIVYRGSSSQKFQIKRWMRSRYGFNALFFSTEKSLAQLYAQHRAEEECILTGGFVYEFEIPDNLHTVDYGGKSSYNREFRNLMFRLFQENHNGAIIKNVIDYPSKKFFRPNLSDVIVIFDFAIIRSYKLIERNVRVL